MSSMNGRKWRRIPPGAHLAAQNGIARLIGFAGYPPMQKTSGFGIRISLSRRWRISAGFQGAVRDRFSAWADFRHFLRSARSQPAQAKDA